jgi:6-phosphofructokinase 1
MFGTDMTIGADTALHRIVEAVDSIAATAASHQRSFVVEVMGRHAGYLALMGGLATGANWILIPEHPPEDGWEAAMCDAVLSGRKTGRRRNVVIVAEGAVDRRGQPIGSDYVQRVLTERLGEDTRVTILGHVQRGGAPSAFDRNMSTRLGYAAVMELLSASPEREPQLIGLRGQRGGLLPAHGERPQEPARRARSSRRVRLRRRDGAPRAGFVEAHAILATLLRAHPQPPREGQRSSASPSCTSAARRPA